jgi:hypothetical protein
MLASLQSKALIYILAKQASGVYCINLNWRHNPSETDDAVKIFADIEVRHNGASKPYFQANHSTALSPDNQPREQYSNSFLNFPQNPEDPRIIIKKPRQTRTLP